MKVKYNKPILVLGGGGFIGTYVVEKLLQKNYKVRIYDNFLFGENILGDLRNNKNLEVVKGDISDLGKLSFSFRDIQAVIHLAGIVGDQACLVNKDLTKRINFLSTKAIKELCKQFKVEKFIFASSCSVYGFTTNIVNENSSLNPVSLYAETKIDSEKEILKDKSKDFYPTILRFATVFGHSRRPRFDLVVNLFTAQAYIDGMITVKGSKQWRPFIHASDTAKAIVNVLESPISKVGRQIFNVGDDRLNITIGDLAKLVVNIIKKDKNNKKVSICLIEDIDSDKRSYQVSFNKIKRELGFQASINLEKGVKEMFNNFKNNVYKDNYKTPLYINVEMTKLTLLDKNSSTEKI